MPVRRLQQRAEDARAGAGLGTQPGLTSCPAQGDLFCLLMPSARCLGCAAPSAQNQLGLSHCLCPPMDEDEDAKGFPTLLSHPTPPGTALPVPRLQCQRESFSPPKMRAKGKSPDTERFHRADSVRDLLTNSHTSNKPVQGIRETPELSCDRLSQELLRPGIKSNIQFETPTRSKLFIHVRDKLGCIIRSLSKSTSNFEKTSWAHAYINSGVSHSKLTLHCKLVLTFIINFWC